MVGPEAEATGLVRHASRLLVAGAALRVPLIAVVLRRGYGLGAQAMVGGSLHEPLLTVAWPSAHLGPMGLEGAVRLALRKELEAIADEAEREQRVRDLTAAGRREREGAERGGAVRARRRDRPGRDSRPDRLHPDRRRRRRVPPAPTASSTPGERKDRDVTDYSDLKALFINCTLKRSPETSNTQGLMDISMEIMRAQGVEVDCIRAIDHEIATGVWPDMTEHGWERDEWPAIYERVMAADILVLGMPIWLGEKSSVATHVIERLYGNSHLLNDQGQWAYYGRVGGCIVTGNEDGIKHCAMNVLYSLQHLGYTIPPQADSGWIGEAGPGPSYLDEGSGGPRERLHQPQHHLRRLEPDAPGAHPQRRRRHPRPRQPAQRVGRRLQLRLPQPGVPGLNRAADSCHSGVGENRMRQRSPAGIVLLHHAEALGQLERPRGSR